MRKIAWKPGTIMYPLPAVMVSCGGKQEEYNIITIAWAGIVNTNPPMCSISVRPERHSYNIIKQNRAFVINLTTEKLAFATDWCGVRSGRDHDKFSKMNLTPVPSERVNAPFIKESPVNMECEVREIIELDSHHMFLSEIVGVQAGKQFLDPDTGAFHFEKMKPICFIHGKYYKTGEYIGHFGYSVRKKKKKKNARGKNMTGQKPEKVKKKRPFSS